jgi:hypothetical protein
MKTKIAILGAGTGSAVSILSLIDEALKLEQLDNFEFICIHDPNIETIGVGEGLSVYVASLLLSVLGYTFDENNTPFDETIRGGTYSYWEKANKNFKIVYKNGAPGLHVNAAKFSKWVIDECQKKYKNFIETHDTIKDTLQQHDKVSIVGLEKTYDVDFVIDCRGFPTKEEFDSSEYEFLPDEEVFVNSVIIYPEFKHYDEPFTSAWIHDNGWIFGIPLQHRKAFGFLYNNKMLSEEKALEEFSKRKPDLDPNKVRKLSWNQYYRKKAIDGRILYNGNKIYFFEPHMGLPLHYYMAIISQFISLLFATDKNTSIEYFNNEINNYHISSIEKIKTLISINYVGKNNIDNEYWNDAKYRARNIMKNSNSLFNFYKENKAFSTAQGLDPAYWDHPNKTYWDMDNKLMYQYLDGYDIDLEEIYK